MTQIGLLGDVHGNFTWMHYALDKFNSRGIDTILQLGDLGISSDARGMWFAKSINYLLNTHRQTMYVTPGNHEDYDEIERVPIAEDGWQHYRPHVLLAPRGHRWTWDDRTFVSLGGAASVNRERLLSYSKKAWWEQEAITQADVDLTVAGGQADVMVAHDAPHGIKTIVSGVKGNPMGFEKQDLEYAEEGRTLMTEAFMGVQPKVFLHGHYHFLVNEIYNVPSGLAVRDIKFTTRVLGLACDRRNFALGVLDTDTLESSAWDARWQI